MQTKFHYPVTRLYPLITKDLEKYPSVDLKNLIKNGILNPQIDAVDIRGKCTDVAEVVQHNDADTMQMCYTVKLSAAYCQFLWIVCDIALKTLDRLIALGEAAKNGTTKEAFIKANEELLSKNDQELRNLLQNYDLSEVSDHIRTHIQRLNELLVDEKFHKKTGRELTLAMSLLPNEGLALRHSQFFHINREMTRGYGVLTNSCCIKGISFTLLHEIGHIVLDHFAHVPNMEDEDAADSFSFWTIYCEVPERERFTANVGIICMLFTLLIKDFDTEGDGVHPREDVRLFSIFDNISTENEKYKWLTAYLFNLWAQIKHRREFPRINFTDTDAIDRIKAYFNSL